MRDISAVIEPAESFEENTRAILRDHIALQDCEKKIGACESKTASLREEEQKLRIQLGRRLIAAKNSGEIKHGAWLPYIEKLGFADRTARAWMQEAGYVDKSAANGNAADLDSRQASGVDKRPRKRKVRRDRPDEQPDAEDVPDENDGDPPPTNQGPDLDIDRELSRMSMKIVDYAKQWPRSARAQLAHELRELAKTVEEMP